MIDHWRGGPLGLFHCQLGEGPQYRNSDSTLFFVDIVGQCLHSLNLQNQETTKKIFTRPVCAVALTDHDEPVIILDDEINVTLDGLTKTLWGGGLDATLRFNDVQVDPGGNLLVGTTHRDYLPGTAGLFHLRDGALKPLRENLGLSNGMGWSRTGQEFYHVDTLAQEILVAQYNWVDAKIESEIRRIDLSGHDGIPDGMTVDSAGCLWVAMFGAGMILRLSPEGDLLGRVEVDVERPTSVCFGGQDYSDLLITSATHPEAPGPSDGDIFRARVGITGRASNRLNTRGI